MTNMYTLESTTQEVHTLLGACPLLRNTSTDFGIAYGYCLSPNNATSYVILWMHGLIFCRSIWYMVILYDILKQHFSKMNKVEFALHEDTHEPGQGIITLLDPQVLKLFQLHDLIFCQSLASIAHCYNSPFYGLLL